MTRCIRRESLLAGGNRLPTRFGRQQIGSKNGTVALAAVPFGLSKKSGVQGDGGMRVPSGLGGEAVSDPQSSIETSVGNGSSLHDD